MELKGQTWFLCYFQFCVQFPQHKKIILVNHSFDRYHNYAKNDKEIDLFNFPHNFPNLSINLDFSTLYLIISMFCLSFKNYLNYLSHNLDFLTHINVVFYIYSLSHNLDFFHHNSVIIYFLSHNWISQFQQ